jgi:hypothetical protein
MKTILCAVLLVVGTATYAQSTRDSPLPDHAARPKACDELMGQEKEACLKQGGTVKANTAAGNAAAGGSSAPKPPAKKKAEKDYPKRDSK